MSTTDTSTERGLLYFLRIFFQSKLLTRKLIFCTEKLLFGIHFVVYIMFSGWFSRLSRLPVFTESYDYCHINNSGDIKLLILRSSNIV